MQRRIRPAVANILGGTAAVLTLVQVFAMRWNVVVGGQLFSKSFRGFVEYSVPVGGREGLVAVVIVLALPLGVLWVAAKLLPLWQHEESSDTEMVSS